MKNTNTKGAGAVGKEIAGDIKQRTGHAFGIGLQRTWAGCKYIYMCLQYLYSGKAEPRIKLNKSEEAKVDLQLSGAERLRR